MITRIPQYINRAVRLARYNEDFASAVSTPTLKKPVANKKSLSAIRGVTTSDKTMAVIALVLLFILFWMGLMIGSKPYRDALNGPSHPQEVLVFLVAGLTFSPTNLGLICVMTSIIGGLAKRMSLLSSDGTTTQGLVGFDPVSSALRGLFVYIAFLSGLFVLFPETFRNTTQETYLRGVGAMLIAYTVGYNPRAMGRIWRLFREKEGAAK